MACRWFHPLSAMMTPTVTRAPVSGMTASDRFIHAVAAPYPRTRENRDIAFLLRVVPYGVAVTRFRCGRTDDTRFVESAVSCEAAKPAGCVGVSWLAGQASVGLVRAARTRRAWR